MIESLDDLRAAGPGQRFCVRLTEDEAVTVVTRHAGAGGPLPIGNVALELLPERVSVRLEISLVGMAMQVQVCGLPRLADDRLQFDFHEMILNGAAAPPFIQQQVIQRVHDRLSPDNLPVVVEDVQVGDGWVLLAGYTK